MASKPKPKPKLQPRKTSRAKPEFKKAQGSLNRIGALWLGEGRNGKYMSGRIELSEGQETRILVFKNNYKEESRHPDYIIYEPEDNEEQKNRNKAKKDWSGTDDDDVPF